MRDGVTRRALLVGIGPGGPDQLTVEAVQALRRCDAFLVVDKDADAATDDLVRLRTEILERHGPPGVPVVAVADPPRDRSTHDAASYRQAVDDWHTARAAAFAAAIEEAVPEDGTIGLLVWGDPALYDSTIRVLGRVGLPFEVVPGLSAASLLAARHRLVLNAVGASVTITTGRRLLDEAAAGRDNLVVMLDGSLTCGDLDATEWDIWWGANLGTAGEALVAGPLDAVLPLVEEARARARASAGWVMDTYLLRRR